MDKIGKISEQTTCQNILHNETGSCYKFHREGRTWPAAFRTCQAEDAYLAIINSDDESKYLKDLFSQNPHYTIPGDIPKDAAMKQDWLHFNAGEPNNIGNNETCGSVWRTGFLNDHNCGTILAFICEKPIDFKWIYENQSIFRQISRLRI
ncbi:hemolymph lipopolysaccharide-binding protein-like [Choristoneura fumiferana]|uniref:hemolymph lipopolysaccharide-binding protein-like n=1 Tax=Choristoneura fumiferana TaxID=7141 RepID=UPI003D15904E